MVYLVAAPTFCPGKQLPENEALSASVDGNAGEPATGNGTPWERFLGILEERHIVYDADRLEDAALRAMLHVIDRRAALLTREEADAVRLREAGLARSDSSSPSPNDSTAGEEPAPLVPLQVDRWPHDLVYIKINGLYENSGDRFTEAASHLKAGKDAGLIIDIRNAGGRDFDAVDRIAAWFVEDGSALYTLQTLDGAILRRGIAGEGVSLPKIPTLLLTDNRTVQASELLAAILRTTRGILLLGERTRGDPILRELHPWSEDKSLYLPNAVIRPEIHHDYDLVGIVPHITVDRARRRRPEAEPTVAAEGREDAKDSGLENGFPAVAERDPVLRRAIEILIALQAIAKDE